MTRHAKIQKLANAVKAYRGICTPIVSAKAATVKWTIDPQPSKQADIVKWLLELGRTHEQIEQDAAAIDGFNTVADYETWIKTL